MVTCDHLALTHPEDPAALVADRDRWWYRKRGISDRRLLVECFALLEQSLDRQGPLDDSYLMLLPSGMEGIRSANLGLDMSEHDNPMLSVGEARLELVQGDITKQDTEAIGNAANAQLAGGGGVDGAIHAAGGPEIMQELKRRYPKGCPTGQAVVTRGGKLLTRFVIHAVGPVYRGYPDDAKKLAGAYRSSLELCERHQIKSLSLPLISTGAYGYPLEESAPIALRTVADYLIGHQQIQLVRFVLFDAQTFDAYRRALKDLGRELSNFAG